LVQKKSTATGNNIFLNSQRIAISATSQTALSFVRVYYDVARERVFPFLTAIMDVKNGVVQGITWDDACVFCGGTECIESTYNYNGIPQNLSSANQPTRSCSIKTEECNALLSSNSSSTICDLTLYTVWTGTDANGIALQSQAYRFSSFPAQQVSDRITQLLVPDAAADYINRPNSDGNKTRNLAHSSSSSLSSIQEQQQMMDDHFHQSQQQQQHANTNLVRGGIGTESVILIEEGDL
jgi:hypothetical protein